MIETTQHSFPEGVKNNNGASGGPDEDSWMAAALRPQSVAIIGASDNPEKIGGRPIKYMQALGYEGRLYPVNPQRSNVQGLRAYPDLDSLPEPPEMAVICVPGAAAVQAVDECAQRGVRVAVVISSGFGETGRLGQMQQDEMVASARHHGMRIVGPNTQGLVNFGNNTIASFATLIGETKAEDGPVAIVSQSGAMSMVPYLLLRNQGIGVRHAHATGNESDLTVADFALAVAHDPAVRLILLYMESIANPAMLAKAAMVAAQRGVPILALKSGISVRGQAAASSHTGAIATEEQVINAFFRQNGILRVQDMRELVSSARLLLKPLQVQGPRLVAVSNSGAACVMAADAAERHGLYMEALDEETQAALKQSLPPFASSANPIDLTAALLTDSQILNRVLPTIASRGSADLLLVSLPMSGKGYDIPAFAKDVAHFSMTTSLPTAVASPLRSTRDDFERAGVVTFEHDEDALAALGQLVRQDGLRQGALRLASVPKVPPTSTSTCGPNPYSGFLSEKESLLLVAQRGIPVLETLLCTNREQLATALLDIPAPWVLKICSAAIPHKTEYGLVKVGIQDANEAQQSYDALLSRVTELGLTFDGIIVAPMITAQRELFVGARWDPSFGAIVMVGDGGKYVEAIPDAITMLYPFDVSYAAEQVRRLRIAPLFRGVRGERPLPLQAVARLALSLGQWVHEEQGRVASVDINPLMVGPDERAIAVDALVELAAAPQQKHPGPMQL